MSGASLIHLWESVQALPCENKFQAVLKSALCISANEALDDSTNVQMCRKCFTPWHHGFFTVTILNPTRKVVKQFQKYQNMIRRTAQQESLYRYLKIRAGRVARYTCDICSYKTKVQLEQVKIAPAPVPTPSSKVVPKGKQAKRYHTASHPAKFTPPLRRIGLQKSKFEPQDFRVIQKMLTEYVSKKKDQKNVLPTSKKKKDRNKKLKRG